MQCCVIERELLPLGIQDRHALSVKNKDCRQGGIENKNPDSPALLTHGDIGRLLQQSRMIQVVTESRNDIADSVELLDTVIAIIHNINISYSVTGHSPGCVELSWSGAG